MSTPLQELTKKYGKKEPDTIGSLTAKYATTPNPVATPDQDRSFSLSKLAMDFALDLYDTPKRLYKLGKFVGENPRATIETILNTAGGAGNLGTSISPELSRAYGELSEAEKDQVAGGAIDLVIGMLPMGRALKPIISSIKKPILKRIVQGAGIGAKAGALFPPREEAAQPSARAESAAIGAVLGAVPLEDTLRGGRALLFPESAFRTAANVSERQAEVLLSRKTAQEVANTTLPESGKTMQELAETLRNDPRLTATLGQIETIAETGTLQPKAIRPAITALGGPIDEKAVVISQEILRDVKAELVTKGRQMQVAVKKIIAEGTTGSQGLDQEFKALLSDFKRVEDTFFKTRRQAGLSLREFQVAVEELRRIGIKSQQLGPVKERLPVFSEFVEKLRTGKWSASDILQLGIDYWRQNIFPVLSFARDLYTNVSATASEAVQDVAEDVFKATTGKGAAFARTEGLLRSIVRSPYRGLTESQQTLMRETVTNTAGSSAMGQSFRPFFSQETVAGRLGEKLFLPMHLKRATDTAFRRLGAMAQLYGDAFERAAQNGLRGAERENFVKTFILNPPEEAVTAAFEKANRLGFTRQLSSLEKGIASSKAVQLLVTPFPRWNFQFTHFLIEHSPFDTSFWRLVMDGKATGVDLTRFITRNVEGFGAIALIDSMYDNIDFKENERFQPMDYVWEDGSRTILNGLTPFPDLLFFASLLRGDSAKALKALVNSSFVLAPILSSAARETGIIGGVLEASSDIIEHGPRSGAILRLERFAKGWIPGRGMVQALERLVDPIARRGFFADVPGLSTRAQPVIGVTTGQPIRQEITGLGLPGIAEIDFPTIPDIGTPFGKRVVPRLEAEMSRLNISTSRPAAPRQLLEFTEEERIPENLRVQYETIAGTNLNYFGTILINSDIYKGLSDNKKKEMLKEQITRARQAAQFAIDAGNMNAVYQRILKQRRRQIGIQ